MMRFEAIIAKIPDPDVFWREIVSRMRESAEDIKTTYSEFTDTWEQKPRYTVKITDKRNTGIVEGLVTPAADEGLLQIMHWTIYGTAPHPITPRGEGYPLRFPMPDTFTPKTQPGVIQSVPGNRGGPGKVTTYYVDHPGTATRGTIAQIYQLHRPRFYFRMSTAVRDGLKKAKARAK